MEYKEREKIKELIKDLQDLLDTTKDYKEKYIKYFDPHSGNFCIPVEDFTSEVQKDTVEFLKEKRYSYAVCYLSEEDGYDNDFYCVTCTWK